MISNKCFNHIRYWILIIVAFTLVLAATNLDTGKIQQLYMVEAFAVAIIFTVKLDVIKLKLLIPYWLTLTILPLVFSGFHFYALEGQKVVVRVIYITICMLFVLCLSQLYEGDLKTYTFIWQVIICSALLFLSVKEKDLSFNFGSMIQAIWENKRYDDQGYTRALLGFDNENQLGMFASVLFLVSCYQFKVAKNKLFSLISIVFAIVILINSGSRTPIVCLLTVIIVWVICNIKNKMMRIILSCILLSVGIGALYLYIRFVFGHELGSLYTTVNEFSSYRISYAREVLKKIDFNWLVGIGIASPGFVKEMENLSLDSTLLYYLVTSGMVGLLGCCVAFFGLMLRHFRLKNRFQIYVGTFYVVFNLFENQFLLPDVNTTLICLSIICIGLSLPGTQVVTVASLVHRWLDDIFNSLKVKSYDNIQ